MSGEEKKVVLTPQELAKLLKGTVEETIKAAQGKASEYRLATEPFKKKTVAEENAERYGILISRPKSEVDAKKEIIGFETGTFIDDMFMNGENKPLNGIPVAVQMGIVGNPEVGKSILVQEIALKVASRGAKVVFITSEDSWSSPSPRNDLQSRMRQKAKIMGLDWEKIRSGLFVFDTVSHSELRDWGTLIQTYRYIVEVLKGVDLLVIDSLTLLDSYRGALKYRVMELARYNQTHGITAIYVSQRGSEDDADKMGYAGGIGIGHNLDGTICIDFKKALGRLKADLNKNRAKDNQIKQWDLVHFVRVLGCRLSGMDRKYHEVEITPDGFIRLIKPLAVE